MRLDPVRLAVATAMVVALASSGCIPNTLERSLGERSAPQSSEATPQVALGGTRLAPAPPLRETSLPALASREFALPPGTEVTDYTGSLAAYSQYGREHPHALFGLLNLTSGRRRLVLRSGVNEALGYNTVAPRISDSWMVWEEVSPNETFEPDKTTWRLYAAPVDGRTLSLGEPTLVDGGVTNYKTRPHYVVIGSTVYWTSNRVAGPHQEAFPPFGTLEALDLPTGRQWTLARSDTRFVTLCAADGVLCVTERTTAGARQGTIVRLVEPATGRELLTRSLGDGGRMSHFVRASEDWLSWAVFPRDQLSWPDLFLEGRQLRTPDASATAVAVERDVIPAGSSSIDPAFFDRYVAFESVDTTGRPGIGAGPNAVRRIWIADPVQRTKALLLQTRDDDRGVASAGWWQTCASGLRTDTLLLWNDLGPWLEDQSKAKTLVRLYRRAR